MDKHLLGILMVLGMLVVGLIKCISDMSKVKSQLAYTDFKVEALAQHLKIRFEVGK